MIEQPHFEAYSTPARICLGVALFGIALLVAVPLTHICFMYFMQ